MGTRRVDPHMGDTPVDHGAPGDAGSKAGRMAERTHVLIIVQNLPVPLDRRVWLECQALRAAGYDVSVICPKGPGDPSLAGDRRRPDPQVPSGAARPTACSATLYEFAYSWLRTALLSRRVWRRRPFQVLQACNPPDTYWLLARLWKRARRAVRLRPARPQPGAVPVPVRRAHRPAASGSSSPACAGSSG